MDSQGDLLLHSMIPPHEVKWLRPQVPHCEDQLQASNINDDDCPARYNRVGVQDRQRMLLDSDIDIPFMMRRI